MAMQRPEAPSPWFGYKMRYINPLTGGDAIPTMSTFAMQLLPKGFETKPYRATDSTVFVPVEGTGTTTVGGTTFDWEPHDVIVVPQLDGEEHAQSERRRGDLLLLRSRATRTARILARESDGDGVDRRTPDR